MSPRERCEELGLRINLCMAKHGLNPKDRWRRETIRAYSSVARVLREAGVSTKEFSQAFARLMR